jgi:hypothetical protein
MPLRTAIILFSLFVACLLVAAAAWHWHTEFYILLPGRRHFHIQPPTDPVAVLMLLAFCGGLYLYSPHYALILFSIFLGGFILGSLVGYCVYNWHSTWAQYLLMATMGAETVYGWSNREELDY